MQLLTHRATDLEEWMDMPDCDLARLTNTYRHFATMNRLVAGWDRLYRGYLRPILQQGSGSARLLDIGSGGGDLVRRLARWTARDGFDVCFIGADPDCRAVAYARSVPDIPCRVRFIQATASQLVDAGERFDIVVSNHLLHHLNEEMVQNLCDDSKRLATRIALHADIQRSSLAYAAYPLLACWFPDSFIMDDGLLSIRRSYTPAELTGIAGDGWQARSMHPFRLLLTWTP